MLDHHDFPERSGSDTHVSHRADPLARVIVADLLRTTAAFLLIVAVIVLAVQLLS